MNTDGRPIPPMAVVGERPCNVDNPTGPSMSGDIQEVIAPSPVPFPSPGYPPVVRPATVEPISRIPTEDSPPSLSTSPTSSEEDTPAISTPRSVSDGASQACPSDKISDPLLVPVSAVDTSPATSVETTSPVASAPEALEDPQPQTAHTIFKPGATASFATDSVKPTAEPDLASVPPHFHCLMQVLELSRLRGLEKPLRSWVGLRLPKGTYGLAKTTSFKQFSVAAEKAGVVVLGGNQAGAWIALSPSWHGKVPVPATVS